MMIGSGWETYTARSLGDFNNDGLDDIIARDLNGTLWLYPGTGTGGVTTRTQIGTGWGSVTAIF